MKAQEIFIAHPETKEQANVLKAIAKALGMKFEFSKENTYSPEFVEIVLEAEKEIKEGKGHKVSSEEFDSLWK
jgi:hypothetical protein